MPAALPVRATSAGRLRRLGVVGELLVCQFVVAGPVALLAKRDLGAQFFRREPGVHFTRKSVPSSSRCLRALVSQDRPRQVSAGLLPAVLPPGSACIAQGCEISVEH